MLKSEKYQKAEKNRNIENPKMLNTNVENLIKFENSKNAENPRKNENSKIENLKIWKLSII